jgi:hypothetical protein
VRPQPKKEKSTAETLRAQRHAELFYAPSTELGVQRTQSKEKNNKISALSHLCGEKMLSRKQEFTIQ